MFPKFDCVVSFKYARIIFTRSNMILIQFDFEFKINPYQCDNIDSIYLFYLKIHEIDENRLQDILKDYYNLKFKKKQ